MDIQLKSKNRTQNNNLMKIIIEINNQNRS